MNGVTRRPQRAVGAPPITGIASPSSIREPRRQMYPNAGALGFAEMVSTSRKASGSARTGAAMSSPKTNNPQSVGWPGRDIKDAALRKAGEKQQIRGL